MPKSRGSCGEFGVSPRGLAIWDRSLHEILRAPLDGPELLVLPRGLDLGAMEPYVAAAFCADVVLSLVLSLLRSE